MHGFPASQRSVTQEETTLTNRGGKTCFVEEARLKGGRGMGSVQTVSRFIAGIVGWLVSSLLCCFLGQETFRLHTVSLHPGPGSSKGD